mmetsp:Transcript_6688/g.11683  ORF Transcript_6688/g.11683 Transcript_6688/m.11683 type:complete len:81 (+) Transcript_6688:510-752(+)
MVRASHREDFTAFAHVQASITQELYTTTTENSSFSKGVQVIRVQGATGSGSAKETSVLHDYEKRDSGNALGIALIFQVLN